MAAVDGMLRIMLARSAEALIIAPGEVPVLRRGGAPSNMSMPPLGAELVDTFARELAGGDDEPVAPGSREVSYRLDTGEQFSALLERKASGVKITIRVSAAAPAERPAPAPAPRPTASPAASPAAARSPESAPVASIGSELEHALAECERRGASDLILSAGRPARLRIDSRWVELPHLIADDDGIRQLVAGVLDTAAEASLADTGNADFAIDRRPRGGLRFRANLFRQHHGLALALRPIRTDVPTLDELGLPSSLHRLTGFASGLVLMTGPAGSGKSTTLVALIEQVNRSRPVHVITIEDPIEYEYRSARALIHQREVGRDVVSFAAGLRGALREAPDIILVGEMRDLETISAALTAAETGHLVLGTLHCGNAASAVDRIIDVYPAHQQRQVRAQLASSLRAVVTQVLVPEKHGGRVPAYETMLVTPAIANQIREDKTHQIESQIWTSKEAGMVPLERTLANLVVSGRVDAADARAVSNDPDRLDDLVRQLR